MKKSYLAGAPAHSLVADDPQALNIRRQVAYALPVVGALFFLGPVSLLQGIYATYFGVTLTAMASALLIARLFDAATDPLVGYLSDKHYVRSGSRKKFVIGGGVLLIISSYFLYVPVDPDTVSASTQVSISYFLGWYLAFYLSYTLLNIPHMAQGSDLSADAKAKNTIFGIRAAMSYLGLLVFYAIPLLPGFDTTEFTPETLQWAAVGGVGLMLPALYLYNIYVPGSHRGLLNKKKLQVPYKSKLTSHQILNNKPLLLFLSSYLLYGLMIGMFWSMSFIYVNSYLDMGAHYALAVSLHLIAAIVSLKVWTFLARRFSKKNVWGIGATLNVMGLLIMATLEPAATSITVLFFIYSIMGCGVSVGEAMAPSVLSDIVDYHRWKFGVDCSASIFSLYMLSIKLTLAIGGAAVLFIAGWYGFDPANKVHSLDAIFGVRIAVSWIPAAFALMAIACIFKSPITARRHAVIRRCLDKAATRSKNINSGIVMEAG